MTVAIDTNQEQAIDFLRLRHGTIPEYEAVEVRAFDRNTRAVTRQWFASIEDAAAYGVSLADTHEVYVGTNLRWPGRSDKAGVSRITCLHLDVDGHYFGGVEEAYAALMGWDLEPSLVVASGSGFHAYYLLSTPVLNEPNHVAHAESLMKRLGYAIAPGDESLDGTQNIDRILRLPGTKSWKPKHGPEGFPVRLVHQSPATYSLDDFDRLLPFLPERTTTASSGTATPGSWSIEDVECMLAHIDPDLPYETWVRVVMGVHSAYPGPEGYDLCDRWSTEVRERNGRNGTLRKQGEKWGGLRRTTGEIVTMGTVVHLAKEGGWEPPKGPTLDLTPLTPPARVSEWRRVLADYPPLTLEEMPHLLRRLVDYLEPMARAWEHDWAEGLALAYVAALLPHIKFENLGLNLWWLAIAPQAKGKGRSAGEIYDLLREASTRGDLGLATLNAATPEGLIRKLDGTRVSLLMYQAEYGGWLASLRREHMAGMKQNLNNAYDGDSIDYSRSRDDIAAASPYVALVATTNGPDAREYIEAKDLTNGHLSRFHICMPRVRSVKMGYRSPEERGKMADETLAHLRGLEHLTSATFDTPFAQDPPCYAAYQDYLGLNTGEYSEPEEDEGSLVPGGRLSARVKKVSALLEACEAVPQTQGKVLMVRESNVEKAVRLVARGGAYAMRLGEMLTRTPETANTKRILAYLKKVGGKDTERMINQYTGVQGQHLKTALDLLEGDGEIIRTQVGRKKLVTLTEDNG